MNSLNLLGFRHEKEVIEKKHVSIMRETSLFRGKKIICDKQIDDVRSGVRIG